MGRAVGFLAAAVAVVAGIGNGINWLNNNVSGVDIAIAGWLTMWALGLAWVVGAFVGKLRLRWLGYGLGTWLIGGGLLIALIDEVSLSVLGYAFAGITALPPMIELYLIDRASHRKCPDCNEEIRARARVCKHCGFRLRPEPPMRG